MRDEGDRLRGRSLSPDERFENKRRLIECGPGPHDFQMIAQPGEVADRGSVRCRRCGGVLNHRSYSWYRTGLKHGLQAAERRYRDEAARLVAEAARLVAEAAP